MKTYLFSIVLLFMIFFTEQHCYATGNNDSDEKKVVIDTLRAVFYLDGKQVPYSMIREKEQKGEIGSGNGQSYSKDAIRKYGEKFRYGIFFMYSKEEEK